MQIWVHDTRMRKVTAINNAIPRMLSFYNSTWHRYLPQATNTFDFTIPKLYSGKLHEDLSFINDRAYFSFRNQGKNYVFYVANMVEDDFSIQLTCNDTNLELNNEQANAFSSDSAQTLAWYLEHMDLLAFTSLKIGINEISDRKRTLTFDSQETKLARLQSLMSQFDAEYEFVTELNNNGTLKQITLNIYQSPDSTHHGVGKVRSDVLLYYGNDVKGVQVTTDKTQLFNMAVFTGQDGLSMKDVERSDKNEDGKEEFYTRKGNEAVYAPLSAEMYPSTLRDGDNWTRKDFQTEYTDVNDLTAYAFRTMKQYAYPIITYTASVQSSFLGNYSDLALGDTVKIYDGNFVGGLALEARVTEQIISFDNPNNNSLVFSNYVKLKNTVSATLQKRLAELVEANTPYTIKLARNNSLIFKNGQGETIITPSLFKADKPITSDVTWRWSLDGNVTTGMTYTVKGAEVTEQSVLTVAAYIGNDEVATTEIDVINVNDGADGAKGDKGETGNGIANTVITYGLSTSETTEPATWASNMPVLVKGMYLWTRTVQIYTNGKSTASYQKGYIPKDGAQGLPGTPGKDAQTQYTHIAYADNATGGGFSLTDNTKAYWGMYQDFNAANSNDPTKYRWSKWKGDQGLPGKPGTDGKTPYIHFAYADDNKGTNLSFTDKNQQYMGYYSDYTEANSTDYEKYTWVDRLANVQIGTVNLIKGTGSAFVMGYGITNTTWNETKKQSILDFSVSGVNRAISSEILPQNGKFFDFKPIKGMTYTQSIMIDTDATFNPNGQAQCSWFTYSGHNQQKAYIKKVGEHTYQVWSTYTWNLENTALRAFDWYGLNNILLFRTTGTYLAFYKPKLTTGNLPSDWSAAPEDTQEQIDSKADSALTQEQLNALEAKRLQMEVELKAKATLEQVSELETFINNLKQEDTDGRQKIIEITKAIEERVKDIEPIMEYSQKLKFMDTYITQGNGGMIIGANDSTTKVVVTPDRISFQSGGSEVAYISQRMLHIDNGVFTMSLQLGHYITRAHPKNEYVNATYFVK
ncbi:phage tail protein [Streptococcus gallolyticus subsp. gallolyticus]|uniref:phage tail protein n=1 Tax=Streptococcus gallolyticus TaxID=315405 RepID=UPI0022847F82|nr:phage tail protein [Streptococcus gallolyticus]MCY7178873.1 phage tail protein [Streptococcus gallolyticus subsp. gallolyticus]